MATVFVASRLPFGLIAEHPTNGQKVELKGIPRSSNGEILLPYGETEVTKDFWDAWSEHNKDFDALKNGVIFAAEKRRDLAQEAQIYEGEDAKTGLEPAPQEVPGIKPTDKK